MPLNLSETVPDFVQQSTQGWLDFHDWVSDNWVVVFALPCEHTAVCAIELGEVARRKVDLDRRGVKVLGLAVGSVESHRNWVRDIEHSQGTYLNFPLIADQDRKVSTMLGLIHPNAASTRIRTVLVIDPARRLRLCRTFRASVLGNFAEILGAIDDLRSAPQPEIVDPFGYDEVFSELVAGECLERRAHSELLRRSETAE